MYTPCPVRFAPPVRLGESTTLWRDSAVRRMGSSRSFTRRKAVGESAVGEGKDSALHRGQYWKGECQLFLPGKSNEVESPHANTRLDP